MFEIHPSNWPVAVDATDPRNQFHERALFEARVATDHREQTASSIVQTATPGRFERMRLAFAGGSTASTQFCTDCPA